MYGLLYECKFLTIEETNKKTKKKHTCQVSRSQIGGAQRDSTLPHHQLLVNTVKERK